MGEMLGNRNDERANGNHPSAAQTDRLRCTALIIRHKTAYRVFRSAESSGAPEVSPRYASAFDVCGPGPTVKAGGLKLSRYTRKERPTFVLNAMRHGRWATTLATQSNHAMTDQKVHHKAETPGLSAGLLRELTYAH